MVMHKKCKNCNSKIVFDPISQLLHCEYCNTNYSIKEEEKEEIIKSSKQLDIYNCPDCGAHIITTPNTTSTSCVYCKNTAIFKERLKGEFFPQAIIPFKSTKNDAIEAFTNLKKRRKLIPDEFLNPQNIEEICGIYIPFWLFSFEIEGKVHANTKNETKKPDGNKIIITTKEYSVIRSGNISYDNIPIDASTHFQDNIMRSIEPYNYNDLKKYSSDYLSGFISELYDVTKVEAEEIAKTRALNSANDLFYKSIAQEGYNQIEITQSNFEINKLINQYVLLPVWMLNIKYKDKIYTFAMNGQTKKMIGNIPLDKKKAIKYFLVALLISLIICLVFATILWKVVL